MDNDSAVKTGLGELVNDDVQPGAADAGTVEPDGGKPINSDGEGQNEGKTGWINSLPKNLRDGIDTAKYGSLGEYIVALREAAEGRSGSGDSDPEWESVLENSSGERKSMLEVLKAAKVDPKAAGGILKGLSEASKKISEAKAGESLKAKRGRISDFITKNWGSTKEERNENVQKYERTLGEFGKADPESLKYLMDSGLVEEPAIITLITKAYGSSLENPSPRGGHSSEGGTEDDYFGIA